MSLLSPSQLGWGRGIGLSPRLQATVGQWVKQAKALLPHLETQCPSGTPFVPSY